MSDTQAPQALAARTPQDIKQDFANTCAIRGEKEFYLAKLQDEIEDLHQQLLKLEAEHKTACQSEVKQ